MHTKDARAKGETEQRIYALSAWREAPFFSPRERAALALAEAITLVHDGHVSDEVYRQAADEFSEADLADACRSLCGPRLNDEQALALADRIADRFPPWAGPGRPRRRSVQKRPPPGPTRVGSITSVVEARSW